MLPEQLTAANFAVYPPEARTLATGQIALLRRLPLAFVPLLLRELIVYDWKFPAERVDLDRQFRYLNGLSPDRFRAAMAAFENLKLARELQQTDWIGSPAVFSEQLSAHLWATHQIDAFRAAAVDYVAKANASSPDPALPMHRLGIAVIGQGVTQNEYRLFRKLRAQGVYYTKVRHSEGIKPLLEAVAKRAQTADAAYSHWCIDGGVASTASTGITRVSYNALAASRATLQARMQKTYEASVFDPEAFRTMMAQIKPDEVGLGSARGDALLNRFQLSLLTEGSGTQVFATTFVQWAAREALRRAQPLTLFAHFAPRQREKPMNELLVETQGHPELDPQGSLIDADMGAWYTWMNLQRLSEAEKAAFLVWFEDHDEAVAIAPSLDRGKTSDQPVELADLIAKIV
jgi:hypothetical protein